MPIRAHHSITAKALAFTTSKVPAKSTEEAKAAMNHADEEGKEGPKGDLVLHLQG